MNLEGSIAMMAWRVHSPDQSHQNASNPNRNPARITIVQTNYAKHDVPSFVIVNSMQDNVFLFLSSNGLDK